MSEDTLLSQQQILLQGLFDSWDALEANTTLTLQQAWPIGQYLRGLQAYRSNASVLAQQVLAVVYPTVKRFMGDEQFDGLAVHLWRTHPPSKGDLAQWGDALEDFLSAIPELMANEPHLPDVAALEWALHVSKTAPDSDSADPVPLAVIDSEFPIVELVNGKNLEEVSDIEGQRALVYRQGFKTFCISIPKDTQL